jgi:acetyl-CoA C-acetyltransferase
VTGPGTGPGTGPVVVAARRTAIGTAGRAFARRTAAELAAPVLADLAATAGAWGLAPREVVLGNCTGPGGDVARVAALASGLDRAVPALTVDRQCASGLAAVVVAVDSLRARPGLVLAGGTESASTAPWRYWPPVDGAPPRRFERAPFAATLEDDPEMGLAADLLAEERGVGRERQDEYAARSHERAAAALADGRFTDEIVVVDGVGIDERPRAGLSVERLGRLRPAFRPEGTVTAGNSCGINDGAAVVAVVDGRTRAGLGVPGLEVLAVSTTAGDPRRPGVALVPAVRDALDQAGIDLGEVDAIEINEAFAGQVLACCDELGLDPARVCPDGGALALGHPWGASGAVLLVRLFTRLVREGRGGVGLAAIAAGGGQGVAMVVRSCP